MLSLALPCPDCKRRASRGHRSGGAVRWAIIVDAVPTPVTNSRIAEFPGLPHGLPAELFAASRRPIARQFPGLALIFWHCTFTVKDKFKILFTTLGQLSPFDDSARKGLTRTEAGRRCGAGFANMPQFLRAYNKFPTAPGTSGWLRTRGQVTVRQAAPPGEGPEAAWDGANAALTTGQP